MMDKRDIAFNIIEDMTEEELQALITLFGKGMELEEDVELLVKDDVEEDNEDEDDEIDDDDLPDGAVWDPKIGDYVYGPFKTVKEMMEFINNAWS